MHRARPPSFLVAWYWTQEMTAIKLLIYSWIIVLLLHQLLFYGRITTQRFKQEKFSGSTSHREGVFTKVSYRKVILPLSSLVGEMQCNSLLGVKRIKE
jgi:hypothetical protein